MSDKSDQRLSPRAGLNVPAKILLLAPDETFSPFRFDGRIGNVSKGGMQLSISPFARSQFQFLLQGPRYAQIRAALPGSESEMSFVGSVVWIDFREHAEPPTCHLGIGFTQLKDSSREAVERALAQVDGGRPPPAIVP